MDHFFNFLSLPMLLGGALLVFWVYHHRDRFALGEKGAAPEVRRRALRVNLWLYFGVMYFSFFPAMWAMGGNPPSRVDNMTYLYHLMFLASTLTLWVLACPEKWHRWLVSESARPPLALMSVVLQGVNILKPSCAVAMC